MRFTYSPWITAKLEDFKSLTDRGTRIDMPKDTVIYDQDEGSGYVYVLEENSVSYTLPIPRKERDLNTVIERLDRPESITK